MTRSLLINAGLKTWLASSAGGLGKTVEVETIGMPPRLEAVRSRLDWTRSTRLLACPARTSSW
jgi:hypothetical protein